MGTSTFGNPNGPSDNSQFVFYGTSGGVSFKAGSNSFTTPEEMYIDQIWVWCGTQDGTAATMIMALYGTGGTLIGQTDQNFSYGTGYGYNHCNFTQANYLHLTSGQAVVGAVYSTGHGLQTAGDGSGGSFSYHVGTGLPSTWSATATKTGFGSMNWKATYFPKAAITALPSSPVAPGQSFVINGQSFSAGVTAITLHGAAGDVAVTSYSVDSDSQITATVPTGASSGHVEVDTFAGNATSSQTLLASGGWFKTGGVINPLKGMWYKSGGVIIPIKGGWFKTGGVINPLK